LKLVAALEILSQVPAFCSGTRRLTQGGSSLARFDIPDVPYLGDSSAIIGDLDEPDSTIVIDVSNPLRSHVRVLAVLALHAGLDHHRVANIVCMCDACSVFSLIVLND